MCELCEQGRRDVEGECAYDPDEKHPSQWPDDATRDDLPASYPDPKGWDDTQNKPYDSNWRQYNPFQGSQTPTAGRCNSLLAASLDRYGEPRYCMRLPESAFDHDADSGFCHVHRGQQGMIEARNAFATGLYSKTIRHTIDKLDPWMKVAVAAKYDAYLAMSVKDFDAEYAEYAVDFSDEDDQADLPAQLRQSLNDAGMLEVGVPVPNTDEMAAFALFRAAVMDAKTMIAERELLSSGLESEVVVAVTDDGREMTELDEHHLNLPLSRMDKDRKELLEFGGVPLDGGDADAAVSVESPEQLIVDLEEVNDLDENDENYLQSEPTPVVEEMQEYSEELPDT